MTGSLVKIGCSVVNGLTLRLYGKGYDDGTGSGYRPIVPQGPVVVIAGPKAQAAGVNECGCGLDPPTTPVDRAFAEEWFKQNANNPLVTSGSVFLVE